MEIKIEIIELLSVETLYSTSTRLYLWLGLEEKICLYIDYSAQLPSYKKKSFTAPEEMSQLLTTHKVLFFKRKSNVISNTPFFHKVDWQGTFFKDFLGEDTAQIPKQSICFFPWSHLSPVSTGYFLDSFFSPMIHKCRAVCYHILSSKTFLVELLSLKFLSASLH